MNQIEQQKLADKIEFPPDRYQRELMIVDVFKMQNEGLIIDFSILDCISKIKEPRSVDESSLIGLILWKANSSISSTWKEDLASLKPEHLWVEWEEMTIQTQQKILSIPFSLLSRMINIVDYAARGLNSEVIEQIKIILKNVDIKHFEELLVFLRHHKQEIKKVDYGYK
ncbi:hypothetical protein Fleli_1050 [Bernardetia litoralis DSM 6794]|uniref:Uncharacterized protein n=1 Tax=Bernardetia litoralis (strain ATCC 23117 / DSM 6794 / NBRC 15988 / NCIMB 1366 / Fx l1 / Sio-4) TaxID=880071 RepID=I4AHR0_BERLS|nr:hypothetical protein [Bernardetia litoralis]AFM03495.1 hypothetical protein Fleli_1050 [Bernardetia litoralis DSM 6794]